MRTVLLLLLLISITAYAEHARIHRSQAEVRAFMRLHPCPSTHKNHPPCPGWIVDHVKPLACGGADDPSNMQWQTVADAKAKDKWERKNCPPPKPSVQ